MILNTLKKATLSVLLVALLFMLAITAAAHPGSTDEDGGHVDRSTGEYHYHHGYPAHEHYDMNHDGRVDCPYDFDDQTGKNSGSNIVKDKLPSKEEPYVEEYSPDEYEGNNTYNNEENDVYVNEEYYDESNDEHDSSDFKLYLITFCISLLSLGISAGIIALSKRMDNHHIAQNILFTVAMLLFMIGAYSVAICAIIYIVIKFIYEIILAIIRKNRIRTCRRYAMALLKAIELPQYESCSTYLLHVVEATVHNRTKEFKPPFERKVQEVLLDVANTQIKSYIKSGSEEHRASYYYQMVIIKSRLSQILKVKEL